MSVILNEYSWAEDMIASAQLGDKPIKTLSIVAEYYYENGFSKRDIRKMTTEFYVACTSSPLPFYIADALDSIIKRLGRRPLVQIDGVNISSTELDIILKLQGRQLQRLAFTLLCLAKYHYERNPVTDHWVTTSDKDILKMANIKTSVKRQSKLFGDLQRAGLIKFSQKIDSLNVQVLFCDDYDCKIEIDDFRNLGYQFLKYVGEPYFECESCGIVEKITSPQKGRKQKYCKACAQTIKSKQSSLSVISHR